MVMQQGCVKFYPGRKPDIVDERVNIRGAEIEQRQQSLDGRRERESNNENNIRIHSKYEMSNKIQLVISQWCHGALYQSPTV